MNKYAEKLEQLDLDKNYTGTGYIYAMLFRKVFLFDPPKMDEDLDDLMYYRGRNSQNGGNRLLVRSMETYL